MKRCKFDCRYYLDQFQTYVQLRPVVSGLVLVLLSLALVLVALAVAALQAIVLRGLHHNLRDILESGELLLVLFGAKVISIV